MKVKSFPLALIVLSFACFQSCSSNDEALDSLEEKTNPQDVTVTLDYTFSESGSLTRAIREKSIKSSENTTTAKGEEIYTNFHKKYLETRLLTPTTYSLTFTNQETGAVATINGRWDKKDAVRLMEGIYEVTGASVPIHKKLKGEPSDTAYLSFNEIINITKDMSSIKLQAHYDAYLLMFDADNAKEIYYEHYYDSNYANTHIEHNLYNAGTIFSMFIRDLEYGDDNRAHRIYLTRNDGHKTTITLDKFPFEKGKYYYFNDMTNSFDIPKMESGN